jgi:O-antigen/teichoic acid export membrane protein
LDLTGGPGMHETARKRLYGLATGPTTPLAKTFLALTGSQVLGRAIRFGYLLVIARFLGPEATAIYLYSLAVSLAFGVVASIGQGVFLASRLGRGPKTRLGLIPHSLALRLLSTVLALGLGAVFVAMHVGEPLFFFALTIFLAAMVVRSLADWLREWSVALEDVAWIPRYEVMFRGLEAMVGSILLLQGAGVLAVSLVYLVGRVLEAAAAARLMHRRHGVPFRRAIKQRVLRRIVAISLTLATGVGCLTLFAQIGLIALKQLAPDLADLAYFGIGMHFLMTLMVFPIVLGVAILPAIGRVRRTVRKEEVAGLSLLIRIALLTGAAIAVLVDGYAPWFVSFAFGKDFDAAGQLLADLVWVLGPYAATVLACQMLNACGAPRQSAIAGMAMVGIVVVAMTLAVPWLGLPGASLSVGLAILGGCILALRALRLFVGPGEAKFWLQSMVLTAALGLVSQIDLIPAPLLAPPLLLCAILTAWRLKLLTRAEIAFVLRRFGLDRGLHRGGSHPT